MAHLLDTSVLVRLANVADADHSLATWAMAKLHGRSEILHITPQVLIEFRNVATRPTAVNGLGLPIADADLMAADFEATFPLLTDTPDIFPAWKAIVQGLGVIGKKVHDARLVAVCHVHAVTHLLTFDVAHFSAMSAFGPGITVVDPASV